MIHGNRSADHCNQPDTQEFMLLLTPSLTTLCLRMGQAKEQSNRLLIFLLVYTDLNL